jgi:hypothetical protein
MSLQGYVPRNHVVRLWVKKRKTYHVHKKLI